VIYLHKNVQTKTSDGTRLSVPRIIPSMYCQRNAASCDWWKPFFSTNEQCCCIDIELCHWKL